LTREVARIQRKAPDVRRDVPEHPAVEGVTEDPEHPVGGRCGCDGLREVVVGELPCATRRARGGPRQMRSIDAEPLDVLSHGVVLASYEREAYQHVIERPFEIVLVVHSLRP
jgi:hypothetical protein